MRADMAAAYFDLENTSALTRAVERGEAPRPTDSRPRGRGREPLWSLQTCSTFVAHRHRVAVGEQVDDLVSLL